MSQSRLIPTEHFQLLFESSPGAFLILRPDAQFTIVGVTDDYLHETLRERDKVVGKPLFEVFPDNPHTPEANSTSNLRASLQRVIDSRCADTMSVQRYDVPAQRGSHFEVRYWSPINQPVLSEQGELLYIVHRVQNVTSYMVLREESEVRARERAALSEQNRKMEAEIVERGQELDARNQQLRQANQDLLIYAGKAREEARCKDEFLAMLAHELRNPLAGIAAALQLLAVKGEDPVKVAQVKDVCGRQLGNLTRLVDDLLDVSRVSRGIVTLRREPLDLRDIVQSALIAVRGLLDERGMVVNTSRGPGNYRMAGDATRLEQVFTNLLTNAAKYTDPGGRLDIVMLRQSSQEGDWAVLEFTDNGRGIPPEKLSAIFGMFVQVDTRLDRAQGGLGIGLPLVKKLVQSHGGSVTATSAGAGRGSTFTVRLPLDDSVDLSVPGMPGIATAPLENAGKRVLIVEDNTDARETLQSLLEAYGHSVTVAASGEEGLQRLLDGGLDVAIIDIGLPGLDGFEVARRARATAAGRAVALIALSGYSGQDMERRAEAAGFDLQLVKPVSLAELPEIIQNVSTSRLGA